jgi:glycosyltransferase involved in cell wall biosynthesis
MRIAVWHNLPSGGGKRALFHQVKGLVERGHEVEIWCPPVADRAFLPLGPRMAEHVVSLSWQEREAPGRVGAVIQSYRNVVGKLRAMEEHCRRCAEEINSKGFDVLCAHSCQFFRMSAIGRFVRLPKVIYQHEPDRDLYEASPRLPWLALPSPRGSSWAPRTIGRFVKDLVRVQALRIRAREERESAAAFGQILVNSFYSRESVLRAYGLEARVCYLGVENGIFRALGLPRDRVVVGLGAIHQSKGIETAIQAVASIPEPQRPALVWIGNFAVAAYLRDLNQQADSLRVKFVSRVGISDDDLVESLNRAAVMVYTSRLEPFGLAPLEANLCETPVVAIAEGGVRETIVDGLNGILVPDRNPALIGKALAKIVDNPAWRRRLGEQARAQVIEKWGWPRSIEHLEGYLMEEIEKSGSRGNR